MSDLTLDQWSNIVTLTVMGLGFVWLAAELARRTRRWNGVGVAMTVLTVLAGLLWLMGAWNVSVASLEHLPGLPTPVRVTVRTIACLSLVWAIHKVRTVELVAVKNIEPEDILGHDGMP
jgi:hypothetical protein